ncbi:MAG TPA: putative quinol monooxygenase [Polyangiaceae bacterium]|jgi:quinol monooxygenase YgiN|nr:putative quinol monooxygenase [Polyangiaceae bacterium]
MTEQVTVIARARAKRETAERLLVALRELKKNAPAEDGCLSYELYQLADDPLEFLLNETWQSPGHLEKHLGSAHMQAFFAQLPELLERQADMTTWKKSV